LDESFDLELELEALDLSSSSTSPEPPTAEPHLQPLLAECLQTAPYEFSAFIHTFPFDPIVSAKNRADAIFHKIGEASYSEVFGVGSVVLKIIPIQLPITAGAPQEVDTPPPSEAKDVLREIVVTRAMGEACDGFVPLLRTYIVRGKYPSLLLDLWDDFNEKKGSEGIRPGTCASSRTLASLSALVRHVHCVASLRYHRLAERWS
jgi:serine/threonine-protein kinase haspin